MGNIIDDFLAGMYCEICGMYLGDENIYGFTDPKFPLHCKKCQIAFDVCIPKEEK